MPCLKLFFVANSDALQNHQKIPLQVHRNFLKNLTASLPKIDKFIETVRDFLI